MKNINISKRFAWSLETYTFIQEAKMKIEKMHKLEKLQLYAWRDILSDY